jgi:GC-rich sequence DNA-binding factor
LIAF